MSVHISISLFNWAEATIPFLNSLRVQQLLLRGILSSPSRLGDPIMVPVSPGYVPFNKGSLFFHVPEDLPWTGVKHLSPILVPLKYCLCFLAFCLSVTTEVGQSCVSMHCRIRWNWMYEKQITISKQTYECCHQTASFVLPSDCLVVYL